MGGFGVRKQDGAVARFMRLMDLTMDGAVGCLYSLISDGVSRLNSREARLADAEPAGYCRSCMDGVILAQRSTDQAARNGRARPL